MDTSTAVWIQLIYILKTHWVMSRLSPGQFSGSSRIIVFNTFRPQQLCDMTSYSVTDTLKTDGTLLRVSFSKHCLSIYLKSSFSTVWSILSIKMFYLSNRDWSDLLCFKSTINYWNSVLATDMTTVCFFFFQLSDFRIKLFCLNANPTVVEFCCCLFCFFINVLIWLNRYWRTAHLLM